MESKIILRVSQQSNSNPIGTRPDHIINNSRLPSPYISTTSKPGSKLHFPAIHRNLNLIPKILLNHFLSTTVFFSIGQLLYIKHRHIQCELAETRSNGDYITNTDTRFPTMSHHFCPQAAQIWYFYHPFFQLIDWDAMFSVCFNKSYFWKIYLLIECLIMQILVKQTSQTLSVNRYLFL